MKFCIQDPVARSTFVLDDAEMSEFEVSVDDYTHDVDVVFVVPDSSLVQELPTSRLTDAAEPAVQILDHSTSRSWVIGGSALQRFKTATPPLDDDNVVWFAMPSAGDLIAAIPVFRRALVQYSS